MAAYSKDDFYYGSDYSDFSENEADLEAISDGSFGSDDELEGIPRYCVCGLPATTEMIACDAEDCQIEWFHFQCVGLSADTIPTEQWFCDLCLGRTAGDTSSPLDGKQSTSSRPTASVPSTSKSSKSQSSSSSGGTSAITKSTQAEKKSKKSTTLEGDKVGKAKGKEQKKVKQPVRVFTAEAAKRNATSYFKTGLDMMTRNKVFSGKFPTAVCIISLVTSLLSMVTSPEFVAYSESTVSALWLIVTTGDEKHLQHEAGEMMWRAFHQFKLKSITSWTTFMDKLGIDISGQHVLITYQYLLQTVLTLLVKDRNSVDSPQSQSNTDLNVSITIEEEQALRYVAGYVPHALYNKFNRQKNETASVFCKILKSWHTSCTNTEKTFLEYTNDWIAKQNRGGLFNVNDDVYLFFRTMENESRSFLTKDNLDKFPGVDIKSSLKLKIMAQTRVHNYWCTMTKSKITGDVSKKLLDNVVNLYIKIRLNAFIKVYLDLKKYNNSNTTKVSKKGEKALRKTLAS